MIDGLIGGKLHGKAARRVGQSGKAFVTAKVRTPTTAGDSLFVNVITFSESVGDALLALDDGDSVTLSGALTPKVWTPQNGEPRPVLAAGSPCGTDGLPCHAQAAGSEQTGRCASRRTPARAARAFR